MRLCPLQFHFFDRGPPEYDIAALLFLDGLANRFPGRIGLNALDDVAEELAEASHERFAGIRFCHHCSQLEARGLQSPGFMNRSLSVNLEAHREFDRAFRSSDSRAACH